MIKFGKQPKPRLNKGESNPYIGMNHVERGRAYIELNRLYSNLPQTKGDYYERRRQDLKRKMLMLAEADKQASYDRIKATMGKKVPA